MGDLVLLTVLFSVAIVAIGYLMHFVLECECKRARRVREERNGEA